MANSFDDVHKFATLVDLLRYRGQQQADKTAYIFLEEGEVETARLTYQELDRQARAIAASLQSIAKPGERALLLYPSGLEFIAAFLGCLYAGIVAVPAYPPRPNQKIVRLQAIVTDAQATIALSTTSLLPKIQEQFAQEQELSTIKWLASDDVDIKLASQWQEPDLCGNTLAFLQYTSGSTGTPKGVMVSHGNLLHNERLIKMAFGHSEKTIFVGWLPLFHDMGLIGNVLQPLYLGIPCILMPPTAFLQKPIRWLQAISRYRATTSGGPNFAYELCVRKITPEQCKDLDLSSWDVAFNGSEPVRAETLEQFSAAFRTCGFRPQTFYPCYGMAETTLFVSGGLKTVPPVLYQVESVALEQNRVIPAVGNSPDSRIVVGCGQTFFDKIAIADPETKTLCPPNQVGEIWVSGHSVAQGYWNRNELSQQTFQAYLADTQQGPFLRTGDLGFMKDDGEIFITGRLKDVIIIRGRNHYPQDIELTVEKSHPALRPGCGAAFSVELDSSEQLVIVQEVERTHLRKLDVDEVVEAIRKAVSQEHELQVNAVVLIKTASIPKTSSGKLQRHACKAGFLEGSLETVGSWMANPIPQRQKPSVSIPVLANSSPDGTKPVTDSITTTLNMHLGSSVVHDSKPLFQLLSDTLGTPKIASRLREVAEQIKNRSFSEQSSALHSAYTLTGEVATYGILLAALEYATKHEPSSERLRSTIEWTQQHFEQQLKAALSLNPAESILTRADATTELLSENVAIKSDLKPTTPLTSPAKPEPKASENGHAKPAAKVSPQTAESIQNWIVTWLSKELKLNAKSINPNKSFADYGIDSVVAVELAQGLGEWLGCNLDATLAWNFPTIKALASHLADDLSASTSPSAVASEPPSNSHTAANKPVAVSTELETLSEVELAKLLAEEIAKVN